MLKPLSGLSRRPLIGLLRGALLAAAVALPVTAGVSQMQDNNGLSQPLHDPSNLPPLSPLIDRHPDRNRLLEDAMKMEDNQKRFAQLNVQRQKEMTSDTEKLVALASQVKAEMDKNLQSGPTVLSIREVEQIEKLAHSVRDKMRATVAN